MVNRYGKKITIILGRILKHGLTFHTVYIAFHTNKISTKFFLL